MKVDKRLKIDECVSRDASRFVINFVKLEGDWLVATDGRMLSRVPCVREEEDVDGVIPVAAFKAARKLCKNGHIVMRCLKETIALSDGTTIPRVDVNYPNWKQAVPSEGRPVKFKIAFNARLLASICDSFGGDGVQMEFLGDTDPIIVKPGSAVDGELVVDGGVRGILMPCRLS